MIEYNDIVACICEGGAETAIMNILFENNLLIFDELLDDKIIRSRSAKKFEKEYLRKDFNTEITIFRILDSRGEAFNLSKLYKDKVKVINIITAPEIEMLIIYNENCYKHFKNEYNKHKVKPNEYCKTHLNYKNVKSEEFVANYFSNYNILLSAIKQYRKNSKIKKGEMSLIDLIKPDKLK